MNIESVRTSSRLTATALVVGVFPGRRPAPGSHPFLRGNASALAALDFDGAAGQTAVLPIDGRLVAFVGLGDEIDLEALRQAAGTGRKAVASADVVATTLHRVDLDGAVAAVVEGFGMGGYRYDRYKSTAADRPEPTLELLGGEVDAEAVEQAKVVVEQVNLARDLVNRPAAGKAPLAFAAEFEALAADAGVLSEVISGEELVAQELNGLLGVGGGSHRPPCLLRLEYRPRRPRATLALVGKGIVFDSGGLSLKTAEFMMAMKDDMAGAAAIASAVLAIARLGLPVRVIGFAALAENLPGGGAQRPGDVITYRNRKTVEVLNTDAEGRLVLADALCLASEAEPDLIVDLATLTGACKVALGPKIAGAFGNDQPAIDRVLAAAETAGERVWPMPMPSDYRSLIDSDVADMKNTVSGRYGGAQAAALLLAEFVGETPWVHLDIAGPAFLDSGEHYLPKGGTGFGVRTLVELARSFSARR